MTVFFASRSGSGKVTIRQLIEVPGIASAVSFKAAFR
jgi:hypothetical protein